MCQVFLLPTTVLQMLIVHSRYTNKPVTFKMSSSYQVGGVLMPYVGG